MIANRMGTWADVHPGPCVARMAAMALACAVTASGALAQASRAPVRVGEKPSAAQLEHLGPLRRVDIDGRSYQVVASVTGADQRPATRLLGPDGVVGQSFHEVVIGGQPTADVRHRLASLISRAMAARYYDAGDVSILRFTDIYQAAAALAPIRAALPAATVGLPISFNVNQPR